MGLFSRHRTEAGAGHPWYGVWWGGPSYATPIPDEDLEEFASLDAVLDELVNRRDSDGKRPVRFRFVNQDPVDAFQAVVSDDSEICLYADPGDLSYPAYRAYFDEDGNARMEEC